VEYAARGGTTTARYGALNEIAWYRLNSSTALPSVAFKTPRSDIPTESSSGGTLKRAHKARAYNSFRIFVYGRFFLKHFDAQEIGGIDINPWGL